MNLRQKPNGIWIVDYEDDTGKRRRVSTGVKSPPARTPPPDAKAAAREIILGVRKPKGAATKPQKARKRDGRMTMSDLFERCEATVWHPDNARSQATIRSNLKFLRARIGDVAVEDMTFTVLEDLVLSMKDEGYKPATIKRKLDMVSKALRMATKWADDNGRPLLAYKPPMPTIRVNNIKDRVVSEAEEAALFNAAERRRQQEPNRQWFRMIGLLRFLFDTAARLGEALGLSPDHLQEMGDHLYVTFPRYRTKNGKPRTVPLTPAAHEALSGLWDHLGVDKETGEFRFFPITSATAWYMFRQLREDVARETGMDMSDVTLHTIRHTTLTRLARGGMDLARLQEWAGHSDPKITKDRYVHLRPNDLVDGVALLSNPTSGDIRARNGDSPVSVPDTTSARKGATPGTPRLQ